MLTATVTSPRLIARGLAVCVPANVHLRHQVGELGHHHRRHDGDHRTGIHQAGGLAQGDRTAADHEDGHPRQIEEHRIRERHANEPNRQQIDKDDLLSREYR